jgi:hypothetical protein
MRESRAQTPVAVGKMSERRVLDLLGILSLRGCGRAEEQQDKTLSVRDVWRSGLGRGFEVLGSYGWSKMGRRGRGSDLRGLQMNEMLPLGC